MKSSDRTIIIAIALLGAVAAAWFLLISPKRDEISTLDGEIASVRDSLGQQEQLIAAGEQAQQRYDADYRDLVVLGKAVPNEDNTSSLFVEIESIAETSGVRFESIDLDAGSGAASAPPPPPAGETTTDDSSTAAEGEQPTTTGAATEASAALLPIGATVGPAGLPVMPYSISLSGDFFQIADFLAGIDKLVGTGKAIPTVDGRLVTINGFDLAPPGSEGSDVLAATLSVTTYVSPADQGLTAGASPAAPAPSTGSATVPTSNPTEAP